MAERLRVFVSGRVQGVGFRYATVAQARALGLTGWVRNLPDERVEALFEGPRTTLDSMLDWCHHGPAFASVQAVETIWESAPPEFDAFSPRH